MLALPTVVRSRLPWRVTPLRVPPEAVPLRAVPDATVAPASVPPDRVNVLLTCAVVATARLPPDRLTTALDDRLWTVSVPVECVMVTLGLARLMTTSSTAPGSAPVLQLPGVFQ